MSDTDLVALVCCDLGAIVRGRSLPASEIRGGGEVSVGWVPANHALTPVGTLAEPNPFGSTGDLRLRGDLDTRVKVEGSVEHSALEFVLCDIVETDGRPWECCPRTFLRDALDELDGELGLRAVASFEHEFQLLSDAPPALPFSLEEQRRVDPFPGRAMGALEQAGLAPERFMPEYASHQFEIPLAPAEGLAAADRAVCLREVIREVARREGTRASFTPLLDPAQAGNGVHVHLSLRDGQGEPVLYDAKRPGCLSELGGSFAAGVLAHARALSALTAASPVSGERLRPHHWSAGAVALGPQNREALLRIPPLLDTEEEQKRAQMRVEYRGADAAANPYLVLGSLVRAGLAGVREGLAAPELLQSDPATLAGEDAERHRVGALPATLGEALEALADDETVRGWMSPTLYDAYVAVKRAELEATADLALEERCARYVSIY